MVRTFTRSYIIATTLCMFVYAGNNEELFLRANKFYESLDYNQALVTYEQMPQKGRAVLYNMGNCFFHMKDYAQALAFWERAQKGAAWQEYASIQKNKMYVLNKLHKNDASIGATIKKAFDTVSLYISLFNVQLLFLLCWYIFMVLYARSTLRRYQFFVLSTCLFVLFIILLLHQVDSNYAYGIVAKKRTVLYSGPHKEFDTVGSTDYANRVLIEDSRQGWYKVRDSGKLGWIEADAIHII